MELENQFKLFPKNEDWATGDEALDLKLNIKLKNTIQELSLESISSFYFDGLEIKPRAYNPLYKLNIETVTKGMLAILNPTNYNDHEFKKIKGHYYTREKILFDLPKKDIVIEGLILLKKFRYENQIDFFKEIQNEVDRNPYVPFEIKKSPTVILTKIIFKDVTKYLSNEIESGPNIEFIKALRTQKILLIPGLGEFWFDVDQIYSI